MNDDYEKIAHETAVAMEAVAQAATRLAQQEITFKSPDGLITVRVTAGGTINGIELSPALLRRQDSAAAAKLVTDTLRAAQLKARNDFHEAFEASVPERVRETNRLIRESVRE